MTDDVKNDAEEIVWVEPARSIAMELGRSDDVAPSGASDTFVATGEGHAWIALTGTIDLFYVAQDTGRRHHICRVPSGGIAADNGLFSETGDIILVPSNGARILATTLDRLMSRASASETFASKFNLALMRWVDNLTEQAVTASRPSALPMVDDHDGKLIQTFATVHEGLLWLPSDRVIHALWGDDVPATLGAGKYIPLVHSSWAKSASENAVDGLDIVDWIRTDGAYSDLTTLHERVMNMLVDKFHRSEQRESELLAKTRAHRSGQVTDALSDLQSVMVPEKREFMHQVGGSAIVNASAAVFHDMGIERPLSAAAIARIDESSDPVGSLGRETRLFVRRVDLSDPNWWRSDHGPLLGFKKSDMSPCALLPGRRGRYDIVDPQTGTRKHVNKAIAEDIDSDAFSFNDPLPSGEFGPKAVFGFAMQGAQSDARAIIVMAFLTGALSLVVPIATSWIMDPVIPEAELNLLWVMTAILIVGAVSTTAFALVQGLAAIRMEGIMANRMQSAVWDRLLRLPASFFRNYTVGDLANRAQSIDQIRALLTGTVVTSMLHSVSGLFSLGYMFFVSWQLALAAFVGAIIYCIIAILIGRKVLMHNREKYDLAGKMQGMVLQFLNSVGKLRVSGTENGAFVRWAADYATLMGINYSQQRLTSVLQTFKEMFLFILTAAIIALLGFQGKELLSFFQTPRTWDQIDATALHEILPTAKFVSFNVAFGQFMAAIFGIAQQLVQLTNLKPLYDQVTPILEARTEEDDGSDDPGEITGAIEMNDLHFRYAPEAPLILDGFTLQVEPGQFVAVVGPSGAGKSTLVRLLLGFDKPEAGTVFFDGQDIATVEKTLLRRQMGVVLQNGRTLAASLFDNIAAGANVNRDDAMEAAKLAGLDKDIERMPMGLDTYVSEGAATLSGGQRQRLMIARAVVRKPKILIFDEATSALDNETQAQVSRGLEGLDATRIVIAHRLSTIINADRIIVLSGGVVAEDGSYQELMEKDGIFADLARRQLA